jgi:hypothetical protein
MVILHTLFDLKPGVAAGDFRKALDEFCWHLGEEGYVKAWRWMRQVIPSGPAFPRPLFAFPAFGDTTKGR